MENEGIMALPEGQGAQPDALPQLSSADTYDAVLTGLGNNSPEQSAAVKSAVRQAIAELNLSPEELDAVLQVLEYMSQNPQEYGKLRQSLIDRDLMDPDDLPEQYDAEFLGTALMVLNEAKLARAETAQAVTQMAPEVEGLGPLPMAEGGLADMARVLAAQGRNGDTMLAHITPAEARLLKSRGGAGTYNPYTGLPEFFLKKLFKGIKKAVKSLLKNPIVRVVATVALASFMGPAAASVVGTIAPGAAAATAAAASTALASVASSAAVSAMAGEKIDPKSLLINAATSYFGAGGTIGGYNPVQSIAKSDFLRNFGITPGSSTATGIATGITNTAIGRAAGMDTQQALLMGIQSGVMAGMQQSRSLADLAKQTPDALKEMGYSDAQVADIQKGIAPGAPAVAQTKPAATPAEVEGAKTAAAQTAGAGGIEQISTAMDLPRLSSLTPPPGMQYDVGTGKFVPVGTVGTMAPSAAAPGGFDYTKLTAGQRFGEIFSPSPGNESTIVDRLTNAFLVNPAAKTDVGRYLPAGLTLAGIGALTGSYKSQPVDQNPAFNRDYTGMNYIRDNPQLFGGSLGRVEGMPAPYNPLVPTSPYGPMPMGAPPTVIPRGATLRPAGIVQPYNIAGLYGVPDLNPPVEQPIYMNRGGDPSKFPRKTGPINGPGTGTSDSIPAMLSDGEFVFTAKAVRNAGGGSRRKGAKRMYALMKKLEGGPVMKGDA